MRDQRLRIGADDEEFLLDTESKVHGRRAFRRGVVAELTLNQRSHTADVSSRGAVFALWVSQAGARAAENVPPACENHVLSTTLSGYSGGIMLPGPRGVISLTADSGAAATT